MRQVQGFSEKISFYFAAISLGVIIWFVCIIKYITNDSDFSTKIGDPQFKEFNKKYEFIWEEMKVSKNKVIQNYYSIFVGRRFLYACIIIVCQAMSIQSVIIYGLIIFLNLGYTCIIVAHKPF